MKDIRIHNDKNGDLHSIKPVDNNFSDRLYLITLIDRIFSTTNGLIYVEVSRANYDVTNIIKQLEKMPIVEKFIYHKDQLGLSFYYLNSHIDNNLHYLLIDIWFAFEHINFSFFVESNICISKRIAWFEITDKFLSYVMFKGAEEDVIWIGKNKELKFIDLSN